MNLRISSLLLLLLVVNLKAAERTEEDKLIAAERILNNRITRSSLGTSIRVKDSREMLTVFSNSDRGFAIVANDNSFPEVIGYSYTSYDDAPLVLEWYLSIANQAMKTMVKNGEPHKTYLTSSEYSTNINPLLSTEWDQGQPYNNKCPSGNGSALTLFPTGCVATALAQIMKYHNYPEKGIGSHQYSFQPASGDGRILSANFGETYYDWTNMLDSYKTTYTDDEADAVATLMLHCGVAVDMGYTSSGSGSYGVEACQGIKNYFDYNKGASIHLRNYYSAELWMKMVYEELNKKRPIYYAGSSEGLGGHAFVIDGYNEEGLVHVNWGWGGKANGFFDIALLNPQHYQFSTNQSMILNFCKPGELIETKSQLGTSELTFNFYGNSVKRVTISSSKLLNIGAEAFKGTLAAILENAETTIVLKTQEDISINPFLGGQAFYANMSLQGSNLSTIPDGTYRLYAGCKAESETKWQLIRTTEGNANSYIIRKNGDDITWEASVDDTWADLPTAIQESSITNSEGAVRYFDLQGREVPSSTKGLLIRKQGNEVKKVVVK